ncbi:hypothetical protein AA19596_2152 [Acetobacter fabarum DSM 19596]|nr:hypothetical protein AA19596_2152 [Acetobacter fabarum DSM 19596]
MNDNSSTTLHNPFAHLNEATNGLTSAARKPNHFYHPPVQTYFHLREKIFRHLDLHPRRACEHAAFAGLFYHIPAGTQPYSPSRQTRVQIRDDYG